MKLNPTKCNFGVKSGKFLRLMVIEKGIVVNPKKVRAIMEMVSPKSIRDVQRFTWRNVALSRFFSRLEHCSYPSFHVLCKAQKFSWDDKREKAFKDLESHLASIGIGEAKT